LAKAFKFIALLMSFFQSINIGRDSDFQLKLDNLVVKGPGNFRIDKLRANLKDLKFDFIVSFPKLDMRGKYQLSFNFLGTSLKAQGDMVSIFGNYTME